MDVLLFGLLFASLIEPKPSAPADEPNRGTVPASCKGIVVVADGSGTWTGAAADTIIDRLRSELGQSWSVHIMRFDAESTNTPEVHVKALNSDLVQVQPGLSMKDALAVVVNQRARFQDLSAVVVIARGQHNPTYVRTDTLASSLRESHLPVYTIHLSRRSRRSVLRRISDGLSSGVVWMVEALIEEDREVYSPEDTGRMLARLSEATGGTAYAASTKEAGLICAKRLAGRISE